MESLTVRTSGVTIIMKLIMFCIAVALIFTKQSIRSILNDIKILAKFAYRAYIYYLFSNRIKSIFTTKVQ